MKLVQVAMVAALGAAVLLLATFAEAEPVSSDPSARAESFLKDNGLDVADLVVWCVEESNCAVTLRSRNDAALGSIANAAELASRIGDPIQPGKALLVFVTEDPETPPDATREKHLVSLADAMRERGFELIALLIFPPDEETAAIECRLTRRCS